MEYKQIKDLMNHMRRTGATKVKIKQKDFEVELEMEEAETEPTSTSSSLYFHPPSHFPAYPHVPMTASVEDSSKPLISKAEETTSNSSNEEKNSFIRSPMVGTFYTSSSPESPPFIKLGDSVNENTVVGIIEAMKVMNELKAGVKGTIVEILVENGQPVEFDTKMFRVK